jgi:hypothetical protein
MIRPLAIRVLPVLLLSCHAGGAQLTIRAEAAKPRTVAGESIVIHLRQKVSAALEMEPVELNRDRTRVRIVPAGGGAPKEFSGEDYVRLHGERGAEPADLGQSFHAAAGEAWSSDLDLLQYSRPLAAGRYRVEISYRYGTAADAVARANPVEVEVAAAKLLTAAYRWFGAPSRRTGLGSIWTVQDGNRVRWFLQTATARDPGAVLSATEFAVTAAAPPSPPRLAHLNDIAAAHYDRFAVWLAAGRLCWQPVHAGGLGTNPVCVDHGLAADHARLADPPLERRAGGLGVVLTGRNAAGQSVAAVLDIAADGKVRQRVVALGSAPESAVVAWSNGPEETAAALYSVSAKGMVRTDLANGREQVLLAGAGEAVAIDQWIGAGAAYGVVDEAGARRIVTVDLETGNTSKATSVPGANLVQAVAVTSNPRALAMLYHDRGKWLIVTGQISVAPAMAGDESGVPQLVASPGGLFLIGHAAGRGFLATGAPGR